MANHPRTIIVTGATGAIGRAIAQGLAATPDVDLIVVGRDPEKLQRLAETLRRDTGNPRIREELADVSSHPSVTALSQRVKGPVDILVNNAAVAPPHRQQTAEGIELVFATNVLGYHWMTRAFEPTLRQAKHARIVNVASYWAGDLDLNDLEFRRRPYDNDTAYRQSKQADRMLTVTWAARLKDAAITVNSCHPGDVNSKLSNDLGFGGSSSPAQGAALPIWLATSDEVRDVSGGYFEHGRMASCPFSRDVEKVTRLAQLCDDYS